MIQATQTATAVPVPTAPPDTTRFMVWNILRGGVRNSGDDGDSRLLAQLELIRAYAPDVLCLPEAESWDQDKGRLLHMAEDATGLKTVMLAPSRTGQGVNSTCLMINPDRLRVVGEPELRGREDYHHALIRAVVRPTGLPDDDDHADTVVLATHLNPRDGSARVREVKWVAEHAQAFGGFPPRGVFLADANTPDRDLKSWAGVPLHLQNRYRVQLPNGKFDGADRLAVQLLLESGWRDPHDILGAAKPPTVGYYYANERVPWALDYVLVAGDLDVRQVFTHPFSTDFRLSDHLPHCVDARLPA